MCLTGKTEKILRIKVQLKSFFSLFLLGNLLYSNQSAHEARKKDDSTQKRIFVSATFLLLIIIGKDKSLEKILFLKVLKISSLKRGSDSARKTTSLSGLTRICALIFPLFGKIFFSRSLCTERG